MRILFLTLLLVGLFCPGAAWGKDEVFSGPQPGEMITPLTVLQFRGPDEVEKVELVDPEHKGATLMVFIHAIGEPAVWLTMQLEWYAHQQENLTSHYIVLSEDKGKAEDRVKRWLQNSMFRNSPISISLDGPEGPGRYGLNRNVDMTVLVAKDNKVVSNFALLGPSDVDAPKIFEQLAAAIDRPTPSADKIREELRAERSQRREMKMMQENPLYKLAPDPQLGQLMVRMIQREAFKEADTKRIAGQMLQWAGDNQEKKTALAKYCRAVLKAKSELHENVGKALEELARK